MKTISASSPELVARKVLSAGLTVRKAEFEEIAYSQVTSITGSKQVLNAEYTEGLRATITAALDFGVGLIEQQQMSIPAAMLAQARLAARQGLELDTVQLRYFAGYSLLDDFVHQEAARSGIAGDALALVIQTQRNAFKDVLTAVREEHKRELVKEPVIDWGVLAGHYVHPMQLHIVEAFRAIGCPLSASDLGKMLGREAVMSNLGYHLKSLVTSGVLKQVEKRERYRSNTRSRYQLTRLIALR